MKIKIGDKVKFLNESGQGTITKIISNDTALVLGSDGFEIPYVISELLKIEEQNTNYTSLSQTAENEKTNFVQKEIEIEPEYTGNSESNIYLAYVPKNQSKLTDSELETYIINDSNYFIFYNYAKKTGENYVSKNAILEPNMKALIEILNPENIDEKLDISVQIIFFDKREYQIKEPFSKYIKLPDVKFYKQNSYKENDFFDEFAMMVTVLEENLLKKALEEISSDDIEKVKKEKERIERKTEFKKPEDRTLLEIDLHIHELIDNEAGLSDHDKLEIQMKTFNSEMKRAIDEKFEKVVFIHGVGNGTLKHEIRRELQRAYKKYQFQDASFKEYGFGATMVLLKR